MPTKTNKIVELTIKELSQVAGGHDPYHGYYDYNDYYYNVYLPYYYNEYLPYYYSHYGGPSYGHDDHGY